MIVAEAASSSVIGGGEASVDWTGVTQRRKERLRAGAGDTELDAGGGERDLARAIVNDEVPHDVAAARVAADKNAAHDFHLRTSRARA
jgi:hypothetical protein